MDPLVPRLQHRRHGVLGQPVDLEVRSCTSHLAWARWLASEPAPSSAFLAEALHLLGRVSTPAGRVWLAGIDAFDSAARVLQATGRTDDVRTLLAPLLRPARDSGWHEVHATVSLRLAASVGPDRGESLLGEALASARAGGLRPLEGEAHLALAELLATAGRQEEALLHSEASQGIARELAASIDGPEVLQTFLRAGERVARE